MEDKAAAARRARSGNARARRNTTMAETLRADGWEVIDPSSRPPSGVTLTSDWGSPDVLPPASRVDGAGYPACPKCGSTESEACRTLSGAYMYGKHSDRPRPAADVGDKLRDVFGGVVSVPTVKNKIRDTFVGVTGGESQEKEDRRDG